MITNYFGVYNGVWNENTIKKDFVVVNEYKSKKKKKKKTETGETDVGTETRRLPMIRELRQHKISPSV